MKAKKLKGPGGKRALFAMAFHCHQPVYNFEWEIEKAYKNSYLPLLEAVEEFPEIKVSFHFSGNTIEWISRNRPGYIALLHKLISNGQVELLGGGYYEPVLAIIPERDRREQLRKNNDVLARLFGVIPEGAWLTEKVWESALVESLLSEGMKYTILDDHHLLRAGVAKHKVYRPCQTVGKSGSFVVFPSLTKLRYYMPFRLPNVTVGFMRDAAEKNPYNTSCFFFADDGEKFGAWPHTYKWVHQKGWLKDFFRTLTGNQDWLKTATYTEALRTESTEEVGEIPPSSYSEMMDWSSGNFKNFFNRYPESGRMHRRMIGLSDAVNEASLDAEQRVSQKTLEEAKDHLFRSQCSCSYWHGTFGGVYFPHLRQGVYNHLIKGQAILDKIPALSEKTPCGDETVISNGDLKVYTTNKGGSISELDLVSEGINLTNMMSRTKEKYHNKLGWGYFSRINRVRKAVLKGEFPNIHDVLGVKTPRLRKLLDYDDYNRGSFLTHIIIDGSSWKNIDRARSSSNSFLKGLYAEATGRFGEKVYIKREEILLPNNDFVDLEVTKLIKPGPEGRISVSQELRKYSKGEGNIWSAVEFNFSIWDGQISLKKRASKRENIVLRDKFFDKRIEIDLNGRYDVLTYPVYTVNETEEGLTKVYQGVSVVIGRTVELGCETEGEMLDIIINIG